jgi:hypothetical protein
MHLDDNERRSFTPEKLVHMDRVRRPERLLDLDTSDYVQEDGESLVAFAERKAKDGAAHRAKVVGELASMSPERLRCRVNVEAFSGSTPVYSEDSDFTAEEMDAIRWASGPNTQGRIKETADAIAALARMKSANIGPAIRQELLRARAR